jgi:hypothetical protein
MVPEGKLAAQRVEITVPDKSDAFPYRMAFVWLCWTVCGTMAGLSVRDRFGRVKGEVKQSIGVME